MVQTQTAWTATAKGLIRKPVSSSAAWNCAWNCRFIQQFHLTFILRWFFLMGFTLRMHNVFYSHSRMAMLFYRKLYRTQQNSFSKIIWIFSNNTLMAKKNGWHVCFSIKLLFCSYFCQSYLFFTLKIIDVLFVIMTKSVLFMWLLWAIMFLKF